MAAAYATALLYKIRPEKNQRMEASQAQKALGTLDRSEAQKD
jgi:hypothetical protein